MPVRSSWLPALLVAGALLVSLTACSDSSDVGLGVGPGLGDENFSTIDVTPVTRDTMVAAPITGYNVRTSSQDAWRFLIGKVDDPVNGKNKGIVEAEGYVDFARPGDLPSAIDATDAEDLTAELRLKTDYLHGNSTDSVAVKVYDLKSEVNMDTARATASFDADSLSTVSKTSQINPSDSLVTIRLEKSWIIENIETLRSTGNDGADFEDAFHGFKIVAPKSEAVVGFSSSTAALRLSPSNDTTTADYPGLKTFTHIEQTDAGSPPSGYRLVQDGIGKGLVMEWDFEENPLDSLKSTPLYGAKIFIPNDTSEMEAETLSDDFERPQPQSYSVIATQPEGETPPDEFQGTGIRSISGGDYLLPVVSSEVSAGAFVPDNVSLPIFQQSLQRVRNGQSPVFTTFRVSSGNTSPPTTLPALVPVDEINADPLRATLTISRPE